MNFVLRRTIEKLKDNTILYRAFCILNLNRQNTGRKKYRRDKGRLSIKVELNDNNTVHMTQMRGDI